MGGRDRGQSQVLGTVLLIGLVLSGASAVVLVGGPALSGVQGDAETSRIEAELTYIDSQAAHVALGDSDSQVVNLEETYSGDMSVTDAGQVWLVTDDGTEILNESLGAVVYEGDRTTIAYQGGGVWRGTGTETRAVSRPEIHFREGTLTFPLITVVDGGESASPGKIRLEPGNREFDLGPGFVEGTQVSLVVHSEFYQGWADYMESRAEGSVTELDHDENVAVIDLGQLTIDGDFDTGIVAQGDVDASHPAATTDTDVLTSGTASGDFDDVEENADIDLNELDSGLERLVNNSEDDDPHVDLTTGGTLGPGSYYAEKIHLDGGTLTVDVSGGNVTIFVEGNIGIEGNGGIEVVGDASGNALQIYTLGDFALANGNGEISTSDDATGVQIYGTSEMHFGIGQGDFTGGVYAPRDEPAEGDNEAVDMISASSINCAADVDVCLGTGNPSITGAIIAGPVEVAQSADFTYDSDLAAVDPSLPPEVDLPPPLTYLHVSVNELRVSGPPASESSTTDVDVDDYVSGSTGTPTPTPTGPTPTPTTPTPTPGGPTATPTTSPTPGTPLSASLSITKTGGSDKYEFDASGSSPASDIETYKWDFDDDGDFERTTTTDTISLDCKSSGNNKPDTGCSSTGDTGRVVVEDSEGSRTDEATATWP
jgi:hypothetical protein